MGIRIDLTGKQFGRLTVLDFGGQDKHGHTYWKCRCICQKEVTVYGGSLTQKKTASCGCLRNERLVERRQSHGYFKGRKQAPTYRSWSGMFTRCYSLNCPKFPVYGGRGIIVCDRWSVKKGGSFENFLEDMGERPKGTTLDRIDNDGNYEPENCRWATATEQVNNQQRRRVENFSDITLLKEIIRRGYIVPQKAETPISLQAPPLALQP